MTVFYSWLVSGLVLCALEFVVPGFVIIFFGAGAVLTAFVALVFPAMPPALQTGLFLLFSIASLVVFRRQAVGRGARKDADAAVDYDDDFTGRQAVVTEAIAPGAPGAVEFNGVKWNAEAETATAVGTRVRIVSRDGLTLKVMRNAER